MRMSQGLEVLIWRLLPKYLLEGKRLVVRCVAVVIFGADRLP